MLPAVQFVSSMVNGVRAAVLAAFRELNDTVGSVIEKFGVPPLMVQVLSVTLPLAVMVPSAAKAVPQNRIAADAMLESAKFFHDFHN